MNIIKHTLAALTLTLTLKASAFACSVYVNDIAEKNTLAAQAYTEQGVTADKVISTEILSYSKNFAEEDPSTLCPLFLESGAQIRFSYRINLLTTCSAQMQVEKREQISGDAPLGPLVQFTVTAHTSACSTVSLPLPTPRIPIPRLPIPR